jgi:mono/diheme cytochrome c family protein
MNAKFSAVLKRLLPLPCAAILLAGFAATGGAAPANKVDFTRDIRPILSDNCYACHGPDAKALKGKLRLDLVESATKPAKSGKIAIVPGKPAESELIARLKRKDETDLMPPPETHKKLSTAQIDLFARWIEQGAEYKGHWAYQKIQKPALDAAGGASVIDRLILARLAAQGLKPQPEADRVTLIRRLSFDLTGLPPKPAEVDAFVNDASPKAYEKLVDRLLASPHYGERMAMYWLDLVRYADTRGYHGDQHQSITPYRDYVISAFNRNLPFDRFTAEQLAGDLLPNPSLEQKVASGYNKLLMTTEEGGAQAKEYTAKYAADRVRNASVVWMGTTLGCCECHDHKYDPFTQRDFYSMAAFFADVKETAVGGLETVPIPTAEQTAEIDRLTAQIAPLKKSLEAQTPALDAALAEWEKSVVRWTALKPAAVTSSNGVTFKILDDASIHAGGKAPEKDTYTLAFKTSLKDITALRIEVTPEKGLPKQGPGRADNGNFVLTGLAISAADLPVEIASVEASHSQKDRPVKREAKGFPKGGWAVVDEIGKPHFAVVELKDSLGSDGETTFTVKLHQNYGTKHTLGNFRVSATTAARPVLVKNSAPSTKEIAVLLDTPADKRTAKQKSDLAAHYRTFAPALAPVRKQIAELEAKVDAVNKTMPRTMVSMPVEPRMVRVLPRGNWLDDSGTAMQPAIPVSLGRLNTGERRATRLDLAQWLTSRENPLVARVLVNRLWKITFGRGLVTTLEDFGAQGTNPSHPELLDALASELIDSGWDIKQMLRRIATSDAYRRTSRDTPDLRFKDPYNSLLARQGRFRLDAEMVRDNALAVAGLLQDHVGGNSVKPYQPAGYWSYLNFPKREWENSSGEGLYRRGVYTYWCRTFLHPSLAAFDASTREECVAERVRSNTPQQALVLLNDPTYVEAARSLAERILREGGATTDARIQFAFRETLSRKPAPDELKLLTALQQKHAAQYAEDKAAAEELLRIGAKPTSKEIAPAELAAWTSVSRTILNLHEAITRN